MKEQYHRIEDLIEDSSFISWVHQTDPEAISFWEQWKEEHPDQEEMLETAVSIVKGIRFSPAYPSQEKIAAGLAELNARIDARETGIEKVGNIRSLWKQPVKMAAAIAALLLLGFFGNLWLGSGTVRYQTDYGEQLAVDLADGTQLFLNANSSLSYKKENPRKIWLDGEAFFKVASIKESSVKFEVLTNDLKVEVYGTEFNVNSRKQQTQVILEEGEIKLALKNGDRKEMKPGDLLTFSAAQNKIIEETKLDRFEPLTSWKDGTLLFEDISLAEAMDKVGEIYGLEIKFEQVQMAEERMFLAVPIDNLDICLQAIERSGNLNISVEGDLLKVSRPPN